MAEWRLHLHIKKKHCSLITKETSEQINVVMTRDVKENHSTGKLLCRAPFHFRSLRSWRQLSLQDLKEKISDSGSQAAFPFDIDSSFISHSSYFYSYAPLSASQDVFQCCYSFLSSFYNSFILFHLSLFFILIFFYSSILLLIHSVIPFVCYSFMLLIFHSFPL